tara:strand:+ start:3282 stop:3884 length:603 start_codon:yes stop_codon:yes gene_type:complete
MYNKIAQQLRQPTGIWGKIISKFLKKMNGEIYTQMIKEVDANDDDKIYEIGYGHGSGVFQLAKQANCIVNGIDFSEVMFVDAVKLNQKFIREDRVHLTFGDFLSASLPTHEYTKVFCVNVIYFWNDLEQPFAQVRNMLTKNGVFFIYMDSLTEIENSRFTNTENFNLYDVDGVKTKLVKIGFKATHYNYGRGHVIRALKA